MSIISTLFRKNSVNPIITISDDENLLIVRCSCKNKYAQINGVIEDDNTILIGDIIHNSLRYNEGYGTLMMNSLIKYAKENGFSHIYGNLSIVDIDHKERLFHFYQKFNFNISEYDKNENMYFGRIDLYIDIKHE